MSLLGFSAEQIDFIIILIQHVLDEAFEERFDSLLSQQKQSIASKPA